MRVFGRDLIRGGHYGQRSCEPQLALLWQIWLKAASEQHLTVRAS
jgi:hypothetical protein